MNDVNNVNDVNDVNDVNNVNDVNGKRPLKEKSAIGAPYYYY